MNVTLRPEALAHIRRRFGSRATIVLFLLVPLAVQLLMVWRPAVQTISYSFTDWDGFSDRHWIGLDQYRRLFDDEVFRTAVLNNVKWIGGMVLVPILFGMPLAVALDSRLRGSMIYRSTLYLPVVLSLVIIGLMWSWMYQPEGLINDGFRALGADRLTRPWLADENTALWAVLGAAVWRQVGYVMMLYLAGLKGIDSDLQAAASVDRARPFQVFRHVTFPLLRPVHIIVVVITVVDSLRAFDIDWVMTKGGPFNSSELLATMMYRESVNNYAVGYGSAVAVVLFAISLVFIVAYLARAYRDAEHAG